MESSNVTGQSCHGSGKSFTEALEEKYLAFNETCTDDFIIDVVIIGKPKNTHSTELGFLRNVVLDNQKITHAGIPERGLLSVCPAVVDLDLSNNLMNSWLEALSIMSELPHLKFVNLSSNKLVNSEKSLELWERPFPRVENLVLNRTGVTLHDVSLICKHLPVLRELHLCGNDYDGLGGLKVSHLHKAECLRLNENKLFSWSEVWKLASLPSLKSLILSENQLANVFYHGSPHSNEAAVCDTEGENSLFNDIIEQLLDKINYSADTETGENSTTANVVEKIDSQNPETNMTHNSELAEAVLSQDGSTHCDAVDTESNDTEECDSILLTSGHSDNTDLTVEQSHSAVTAFHALETLCLSNTDLSKWSDLQALSQFPSLKNLRVKNVKLCQGVPLEERRKLFIACLPNVKILNGSEITANEREKSEQFFLRHFMDQEVRPDCYQQLEAKHGKPIQLAKVDLSKGFCKWANLTFILDGHVVHTGRIYMVDLVGKLRNYIAMKLGLPRGRFRMYHYGCGPFHDEPEILFQELRSDSLPMSRYDIMEDDEIHIELS